MEIFNKILKNNEKAITLIALVITIIVLLILVGISISMLSGDNSILNRATDAKTKAERQSVVEQARTDVLGYKVENKGVDLDKSQLKTVLDTYFKDVPTLEELPDGEDLLNLELTTLDKYGTYSIKVSEIYNGESESSDLKKLKQYFEGKNVGEVMIFGNTPDDVKFKNSDPIQDANTSIVYILSAYGNQETGPTTSPTETFVKYNNEIYKLTYKKESDNYEISTVEKASTDEKYYIEQSQLYDALMSDGEFIKQVEENIIYKYNNKLYAINNNEGTIKEIQANDLGMELKSNDGGWSFFLQNILGEYVSVSEEYSPKMKVKSGGVEEEVNLTPYVEYNDTNNCYCILLDANSHNELMKYTGWDATITLTINNKQVIWTGMIMPGDN